jgi:beta-phosphoglucomutase-like phosphatase (HAD superfamily)
MRLLVLTAHDEWTAGVRLLVALAASLAERGDVVAVVCSREGVVAGAVGARWPRLSLRPVLGSNRVAQFAAVRGLTSALRPDAVLVGTAADAQLAALAMGRRGGIVRRVALEEREVSPRAPWGLSRTVVDTWGTDELAISWLPPTPLPADRAVAVLPRVGDQPPEMLVLAGDQHDDAVAAALRAAAALRQRHPSLRVTLASEAGTPQATRVHAASLGLTPALDLVATDDVVTYGRPAPLVVWSAAEGDAGALGVLAAMQQRVPVVVAADAPYAPLVVPAVTGFHWQSAFASTVVADVARVIGDPAMQHTMGEAAAVRATRDFGWDGFVDAAAARLGRVAGSRLALRSS